MTTPDSVLSIASERTGWPLVPLWSIARREDRVGQPDTELLSVYRELGVVRKADRDDNFNRASEDLSAYKVVRKGDLVLNKMKTWQGSLGVSDYDGIVSPAYFTCSVSPKVHGRYLHYLLRSPTYIALYGAASKGIRPNQWDLPYDEFRALPALVPPIDEQRRIADFLDDQVARIDNIIAARSEQERLWIRFLQAEVDAIFETSAVVPVSRLARVLPGWAFPSDGFTFDEADVRLLRGINVGVGQIRWDETVYWPQKRRNEASAFHLASGDVVMGMDRPWIGEGLRIARIAESDLPCLLLQRVAKLQPSPRVNRDYLFWAYQASSFRREIEVELSGLSVPHLSGDQMLRHRVPFLDLRQQGAVIDHLDGICQSQLAARACLRRSAGLLGELKRSLITAAVTGEFDVSSADGSEALR